MIGIGLDLAEKRSRIASYAAEHGITRVVEIAPDKFAGQLGDEHVDWPEVQRYRTYFRLLQEIGTTSLVVVSECLRTTTRSDLNYNCVRHFLDKTPHAIVFQALPLISTIEDFMILFDFATQNRWRRESFRSDLLAESRIIVAPKTYSLTATVAHTDAKTRAKYAKVRAGMFEGIGHGDPHTIPRNLHLVGARARSAAMADGVAYVGRSKRGSCEATFKSTTFPARCSVVDFPHSFLDFADFVAISGQTAIDVVTTDLPSDVWYLERYQAWIERINAGQAALHG